MYRCKKVIQFSVVALCVFNLVLFVLLGHFWSTKKIASQIQNSESSHSFSGAATSANGSAKKGQERYFISDQIPTLDDVLVYSPIEMARKAAAMNEDELADLTYPLSKWLDEDEEMALAWLDEFSKEMANQQAHAKAGFFLGYLNHFEKVRNLERKTFDHWMGGGYEGLVHHFNQRLTEDFTIDSHHVSIAASLILNEHAEHAPDFFKEVAQMNSPELERIQGVYVDKLLAHAKDEEQLSTVMTLIEQTLDNPRVSALLLPLARSLSVENPQETLSWLSDLPVSDDETRVAAFATVFEEVSEFQPEAAAQILSGEYFLDNYFHKEARLPDGSLTQESQDFFDTTLESFVNVMLVDHPETALEAASAFFDPKKQSMYRKQAQQAFTSAQAVGNVGFGCSNSNCDKAHCNEAH